MAFAAWLALVVLATPAGPPVVRRAQVDITPAEPLPLGGYTERQGKLSEPGGDPLYARALAFEQGGTRIVVVSVETLTIPESLVERVRAQTPVGVKLFIAATHTHCAPDSQMLNDRMTFSVPGIATFKRRYLQETSRKIASAVIAALRAKPEPAGPLGLVTAHPALSHGRRAPNQPDQTLGRLSLRGRPLLWCYAAHPVFYDSDELHTRGDWPGALAQTGGGLPLLGAIGDATPNLDKRPPQDQIKSFVHELLAVRQTPIPVGPPVLAWTEQAIALAKPTPHPGFAKTYRVPGALATLAVNKFAPEKASISAFRVGKLAVIGVPGEPTGALARQIRDQGQRLGFASVWVTSHVNGWIGYVVEPDDYDRGGYEATLAMHGREAGDRVVEASVRALEKLARRQD